MKTLWQKRVCKQFEIIYESLLLEGKAGNLTKLTLEVVLAQKAPAWLQVIHERLKHLIISSETFWNRWKRGYRVKRKMKLNKKDRIEEDKGQKGLQIRNSSSQWLKDKSTKNSIIGILNNWFWWQVEMLVVEFTFICFILNLLWCKKLELEKYIWIWTKSTFHY